MSSPLTASQVLIETLEQFGENEPDDILVIYNSKESGHIIWRSNIDFVSRRIGFLETVKMIQLHQLVAE